MLVVRHFSLVQVAFDTFLSVFTTPRSGCGNLSNPVVSVLVQYHNFWKTWHRKCLNNDQVKSIHEGQQIKVGLHEQKTSHKPRFMREHDCNCSDRKSIWISPGSHTQAVLAQCRLAGHGVMACVVYKPLETEAGECWQSLSYVLVISISVTFSYSWFNWLIAQLTALNLGCHYAFMVIMQMKILALSWHALQYILLVVEDGASQIYVI